MTARIRTLLALPAGLAACALVFFGLSILASFFWPALREAMQEWTDENYATIGTSLLVFFQFVWLLANFSAGFAAQRVGQNMALVLTGAGLLAAYFAYNHWWVLWGVLPNWYNVLVVIPVIPSVWFGAHLASRR